MWLKMLVVNVTFRPSIGDYLQFWYISSQRFDVPIEILNNNIMFLFSTVLISMNFLLWLLSFFRTCCLFLKSLFVSCDTPRSPARVLGTARFSRELSKLGVKVALLWEEFACRIQCKNQTRRLV